MSDFEMLSIMLMPSQFGIVAQMHVRAPALCASLGLRPPSSATGGGGLRPSRSLLR